MDKSSPMQEQHRLLWALTGCRRAQRHLRHRTACGVIWLHQRPIFCLLAGLLIGSVCGGTIAVSPLLILALPPLLIVVWRPWPHVPLQHCCRLLLTGFMLTHLHLTWHQRALPLDHIARLRLQQPRQRLQIEAQLYRPIEAYHDRQRLYLQLRRLHDTQGWRAVTGRVRLTVKALAVPLWPGDMIQVHRLRLYPVRNFENPGRFDYRWLMHQRGIYAVGGVHRPERLQLVQRPRGWVVARTFARWRHELVTLVDAHLPTPINAVFTAMVLGQSNSLPDATQDAFRITGTAHLLVVSGLHVGFVATVCFVGLRAVLRRLRGCMPSTCMPAWRPTPLAALLCLPPVILYCSLVGWRISTIRAALMVGSYLLALMVSRGRDMPYALGLAAALILLFDPNALFTLGFQLSFAAVAAIVLAHQRQLRRNPSGITSPRWQRRLGLGLLTTSAAYAGTLPLLARAFHTLPTYGSLSNVLLVPLAGLIVPAGVVALLLSVLWSALAPWVFAPLAVLLSGLTATVQYLATLPGAQFHVAAPSALMITSYYGLVGSLLTASRQRAWVPWAGLCTALLLAAIGWQYVEARPQHLRITFLDVGTGDAILVEAPGNHALLIDGGGTYDGRFDIGTNVVAPVLWQRYIRRFDLMAITHPHPNHARGLASLFNRFPAQHLLTNGSPLSGYLRELATTAAQRGTPIHTPQTGPRQWQWGKLQLTVLSPPAAPDRHPGWQPPTENDRALVLRLQYGAFRILLTGDIQHDTERWLLTQDLDLRADVLQVPHHGSKTSTSAAFVQRVQPQVGIISAGAGNPYGHPHPRVLDTLREHQVNVFRTDRHGAVTITSDGTSYRVIPFRSDRTPHHVSQPKARH